MAKVTRKGSGRTKGSFSFVKIPLSDILAKKLDTDTLKGLIAKFPSLSDPVVVGRKWAEEVGFTGLTANPANQTMDQIQGSTPKSAVTVGVNLLDD